MTRVRFISLIIALATALTSAVLTIGTGTAFAQPAGHSLNLHHVKWGNVAVPGWLCRVNGPIQLHHGDARLRHSGFGPLDVSEQGPVYGNLGNGQQVAALQVWCSNQGGTAAGELAEGLVVFSGAGGRLHVLGTLTPQYRPAHQGAHPVRRGQVHRRGAHRHHRVLLQRLRRRLLPGRPRPHQLALERPLLQAGPDHDRQVLSIPA